MSAKHDTYVFLMLEDMRLKLCFITPMGLFYLPEKSAKKRKPVFTVRKNSFVIGTFSNQSLQNELLLYFLVHSLF